MKQHYSLIFLENVYHHQDPGLSREKIKEKAKNLHRQLNTMDISWARSNRRFYTYNLLHDFSQGLF